MTNSPDLDYLDAVALSFLEGSPGVNEKFALLVRREMKTCIEREMGLHHPGAADALSNALIDIVRSDPSKIKFSQSGQRPWARMKNWSLCVARRAAYKERAKRTLLSFDEELDSDTSYNPISEWEDEELDKLSLDAALRQLTSEERSLVVLVMTRRAAAEALGAPFGVVSALGDIARMMCWTESRVVRLYYGARSKIEEWLPTYYGRRDDPKNQGAPRHAATACSATKSAIRPS